MIPRNEEETTRLVALARPGDLLMSAEGHMGPTTVIKGSEIGEVTLQEAAALTARYGQGRDEETATVTCWPAGQDEDSSADRQLLTVACADGWRLADSLVRE